MTISPPFESPSRAARAIAAWLWAVAAMIFLMVVIGGMTRLTESGLSIVEWQPFTGWIPPLNQADWLALFEKYKATPQFLAVNATMSLDGFKGIFWLEYIHRVWGRLIGLAFFVPFLVFLLRGWVRGRLLRRLLFIFALGGLQGAVGWFMVASGLNHRPSVSQYRLAIHLDLALIILGFVVWTALDLTRRTGARAGAADQSFGRKRLVAVLALLSVTITIGAFVAGLRAGKIFNTFPLMGDSWLPPEAFRLTPLIVNFFEDPTTVQFSHRVLAVVTLVAVWAAMLASLGKRWPREVVAPLHAAAIAALVQFVLGVATLLTFVPVWLGTLHQAGAVVLLTALVFALHGTYRNRSPIAPAIPA
ncbi:MAG: COX15/CtaA family protein [Alphaproteobacteria bacterium]